MINTLKGHFLEVLLVLLIFSAAAGSYWFFQEYKPDSANMNKQNSAQGIEKDSNNPLKLPQMKGTKEIGTSNTNTGSQITLEISRKPEEIRSFYKNVLLDREWEISKQTDSKEFLTDIYKKDSQVITITISIDQEKPAVVGINHIKD